MMRNRLWQEKIEPRKFTPLPPESLELQLAHLKERQRHIDNDLTRLTNHRADVNEKIQLLEEKIKEEKRAKQAAKAAPAAKEKPTKEPAKQETSKGAGQEKPQISVPTPMSPEEIATLREKKLEIAWNSKKEITLLAEEHKKIEAFLNEVTEMPNVLELAVEAFKANDEDAREQIRSKIKKAISDGKISRAQLNEMTPWANNTEYTEARESLKMNSKVTSAFAAAGRETQDASLQELVAARDSALLENMALFFLLSKKHAGSIWAAMDESEPLERGQRQRRPGNKEVGGEESDSNNEQLRLRMASELVEFEKQPEVQSILSNGGFTIWAPIVKEVAGREVQKGYGHGAVLLEYHEGKRGGVDSWEVVEVFGATGGLFPEQTFNLAHLPGFLEKYKDKFAPALKINE